MTKFTFNTPVKLTEAKQSQQKRDRLAKEAVEKEQQKLKDEEDAKKKGMLGNAKGAEELLAKLNTKA